MYPVHGGIPSHLLQGILTPRELRRDQVRSLALRDSRRILGSGDCNLYLDPVLARSDIMCAHADYREGVRVCVEELHRLTTRLLTRWRRSTWPWQLPDEPARPDPVPNSLLTGTQQTRSPLS